MCVAAVLNDDDRVDQGDDGSVRGASADDDDDEEKGRSGDDVDGDGAGVVEISGKSACVAGGGGGSGLEGAGGCAIVARRACWSRVPNVVFCFEGEVSLLLLRCSIQWDMGLWKLAIGPLWSLATARGKSKLYQPSTVLLISTVERGILVFPITLLSNALKSYT